MIISRLYRRLHARRSPQPRKKTASTTTQQGGAKGTATMALHLFRYDLRAFFRNRQARFFTLALPVLFLVIFASIFGGSHRTVSVAGGQIDTSVYYVPGIIALGIIAAAFVNLVVTVTAQRETGVLKRRRATPVPAVAVITGRALTAVVVALAITSVLLVIGWVAYGAQVPARTAPALTVTVVVGALAFCCLGYALASVIRNEDAAQPVTQAVMLPLYFISGVFVAVTVLPSWLVNVADLFPVRHLAAALLVAYNPHTSGSGFAAGDLLVVAAWGVAGLLVAVRRFSWLPLAH
jgi:ABC-2 type transport system permease protein